MRTTKTKPSLAFPARFNVEPDPDIVPEVKVVKVQDVTTPRITSRKTFRRSPFYLKIEGLTGDRPKYDEQGRLVPEE